MIKYMYYHKCPKIVECIEKILEEIFDIRINTSEANIYKTLSISYSPGRTIINYYPTNISISDPPNYIKIIKRMDNIINDINIVKRKWITIIEKEDKFTAKKIQKNNILKLVKNIWKSIIKY